MKKTSCLNQETKSWGIPKFNSLISSINRGDFLQFKDFFGSTKQLYTRKASQNLPASPRNDRNFTYAIICQSMSSFRNKSLVALD